MVAGRLAGCVVLIIQKGAVRRGREELAAEAAVLREELGTKAFCDSLEASTVMLQEQMAAMTSMLSLKADRAQLAAIEVIH